MHGAARKYAQAYLTVYGSSLPYRDIQLIEQFGNFFKQQQRLVFFLRLPLFNDSKKQEALDLLYQQSPIPDSFRALVSLLRVSRRIELLSTVCGMIGALYRRMHAIYEISVMSSHVLHDEQKKEVERFIAQHIAGTIICTYTVSEALIAGIRIQTDTLLWEHSINQQLHALYRDQRA